MKKWQKITALIMLIGGILYVGYDIFIVNKEESATISTVMHILLKFPFIIYSWFVLGGHFISPFKFDARSIKALSVISGVVFVFSFFVVFNIAKLNGLMLSLLSFFGFFVGAIFWKLRRVK